MGDKVKTWMPMYWADYLANTLDFSTVEHGAYMLLIGFYWANGGPIRNDPVALMRVARVSGHEGEVILNRVLTKFTLSGDYWVHDRVDRELASARVRKEIAKERSKKAVVARLRDDKKTSRLVNSEFISSPSHQENKSTSQGELFCIDSEDQDLNPDPHSRSSTLSIGKREYAPNVLLSDAEYERLMNEFEPGEVDYWLRELSEAAGTTPSSIGRWKKKYDDHNLVIRAWRRRRLEEGKIWNVEQKLYMKPTAIYTRAVGLPGKVSNLPNTAYTQKIEVEERALARARAMDAGQLQSPFPQPKMVRR